MSVPFIGLQKQIRWGDRAKSILRNNRLSAKTQDKGLQAATAKIDWRAPVGKTSYK